MSRLDWALRATVGLYAAFLLVPAAAIVSVEAGNPLASATALIASGVAVAVLFTVVAAGISNLDRQVSAIRVVVPMVGLPLGFFPYMLFQPPASPIAAVAVAGLVAAILGIVAGAVGAASVSRARLADARTFVSFEVGEEDDEDGDGEWFGLGQSSVLVGAVLIGSGLIAFGGAVAAGFFDGDVPTTLFTTLAGLSGSLAAFAGDSSHEIRVTDTGIAVLKRETITDARFEDEEFVVERTGLWPDRTLEATELRGADRAEIESAVDRIT
ncbi:MAG: hypothetical protein ABEI99_05520 [Halobaculum sp.]